VTDIEGPRMYGNWRKARGLGLGSLSSGQTATMFGAVLISVLCMFISPAIALVAVAVSAVIAAAVLVRFEEQSLADVLTRQTRFRRAARGGLLELTGGLLSDHPRRADLPGPMAPLVPLSTSDGRGGRQCLLWDRLTGRLTAIIRIAPVGLDLADRSQGDIWVASFGSFLAELGYHPMVRHLSVTMDTAPSGGTTLRDYVAKRLDPDAPPGARAVMAELVATSPATSADSEAWVAVTFDPKRCSPAPTDLLGAVAEVTRWLPALETKIAACGVAVLGRANLGWIAERLRIAYDPDSRTDIHRLPADGDEAAMWAEAGPVAATEEWDHWHHESGYSVAWAMTEAPRQAVSARVLIPLLSPGPWPRRTTILYEPYGAAETAGQVERQVTASHFRRAMAARTRRDETQRDRDDQARALQAAQEEAAGAGVLDFTLYVSTTVTSVDDLPVAAADVEQRAGMCKIRLRRARRAQLAGFTAALGMGINPRELARRNG
jgi:hypothetical protein